MKTPMMAAFIAGILATTAVAAVLTVGLPALRPSFSAPANAGADEAALHGGMAGDDPHAQLGMDRPRFPPASGSVPSADQARNLPQVSSIQIRNDTEFNPSNGVKSGTGTLDDPYVISGYDVTGDLYIADTDACFEITGNYIDGQLALEWNDQCVWVHHNFIRDLRVNENIPRTGMDTGGLIEDNLINYVGQIRHYDGEFRNNVIGPRDDANLPSGIFRDPENLLPFFKDTRVLNIDGWNEALFHHNTVYGSTDLKLHGHHHSTGFLATHSHYHGDGTPKMAHMEDHTQRWQSVSFTDNKIVDPAGYGLRYSDEQHAGDDRTANSESNKDLEKDHTHNTKVDISRNTVDGAGIIVDIFNADDELHTTFNPGWFTLSDNTVKLTERQDDLLGTPFFGPRFDPNTAIKVWTSKEVQFTIERNTMSFQKSSTSDPLATVHQVTDQMFGQNRDPVAISIDGASNANYTVDGNKGTGFEYGVSGHDMDEHANWAVFGNAIDGPNPLYYDNTVANKPQDHPFASDGAPAEPNPDHAGHVHGG